MALSEAAKEALGACYATRGKHKGQLLAKCPPSTTMAAAAWQGAMFECNIYKASIGAVIFMSPEQKAVFKEVTDFFHTLPKSIMTAQQRDRKTLEGLGVW